MGGGGGEAALRWTNGRFWGDVYSFACGGELLACEGKRCGHPPHRHPERKEEGGGGCAEVDQWEI